MPQSPHNRLAELHNLAAHAHAAASSLIFPFTSWSLPSDRSCVLGFIVFVLSSRRSRLVFHLVTVPRAASAECHRSLVRPR